MNASALLERIREKKIILSAEGEHLHYRAPKGALTSELRREIRSHKNELLEILQDNPGNHDSEIQRRANLFRAHLSEPGPKPFFILPGAIIRENTCATCGHSSPSGGFSGRCQICEAAARLALQQLQSAPAQIEPREGRTR